MKIIGFLFRMIIRLLSKILKLVGIAVLMSTALINFLIYILGGLIGFMAVAGLFMGEYSSSLIFFVCTMLIGGLWYSLERLPEWIMDLSDWLYLKSLPRGAKVYIESMKFDRENMVVGNAEIIDIDDNSDEFM